MSGYPPASSYGPPPGLTTLSGQYQPQHGNSSQQQYQPQYDNTQYDYSQHQQDPNVNAFSNNAAYQGGYQNPVPPFSAAAVASGVPPLPIYPRQWQTDNNSQSYGTPPFWAPPQQQQPSQQWNQPQQQTQQHQPHQHQQYQPQQPLHTHFDQNGFAPYGPYSAGMHLNNTPGPSPMSFTAQPVAQQQPQQPSQPQPPQMFAPPTGPRPKPPAQEGELSEGEYVPSPKRLPPRNLDHQRQQKKSFESKHPAPVRKQKEDIPFTEHNGRRGSHIDHYSPRKDIRQTSFSRQSSQSSPDRQCEIRGGPSKHKRKPAQLRKETARVEAAKKKTPPGSRRASVSKPALEQMPLPQPLPAKPAPPPALKLLEDRKNQAHNAVLNLHGLKVRLPDYVVEGIKEEVITTIFDDLGLPITRDSKKAEKKIENKPVSRPVSKPASTPQAVVPVFPGLSAVPPPAPKTTLPEKPVLSPPKEKADHLPSLGNRKPSVAMAAAGDKGEERKDRIARLLAAKNNKNVKPEEPATKIVVPPVVPAPTFPPAPVATPVVAPIVAPPAIPSPTPPAPMKHPLPPKPTPRVSPVLEVHAPAADVVAAAPKVDSNALLRQKMEALQQKSAADKKEALLRQKLQEMEESKVQKPIDKDAILRQKMENLKKSREKREQEALANQPSPPESSSDQSANGGPPGYGMQTSMTFNPYAAPFQSALPGLPPLPAYPPHQMPFIPGLGIPGLSFGAQSAEPSPQPAPAQVSSVSAAPVNARKRPVASDFDSGTSTPQPYKKPFGHVQQDQCVIDVSEDEEDEEEEYEDEMDLDEPADKFGRGTSMSAKPNMRNVPPLSDFPPRRSYTGPPSAAGTPPVSQSFSRPAARPEDLKRKETEIQEMRRKIAEAEARKKAKLAAVGSNNSTPTTSTPSSNEVVASTDRIETSNQIERLMSDASKKIEEDQQKLAETQMRQEQEALDLKKAQEEQRRKRQAELAANLPAVDADVQETQRRLAEMRAEMQRLEDDMQKKLDDKRRLAEEVEKLNSEADQQLEAQKEQLKEINNDIAIVEQGMFEVFLCNFCGGFHTEIDAQIFGHILNPDSEAHISVAAVTVEEIADAEAAAGDASVEANEASIESESQSSSYSPPKAAEVESPVPVGQAATAAEVMDNTNTIKVHSGLEDKVVEGDSPKPVEDYNSPTKSIEGTQQEAEMSSGSESTPMIESDSSRESESQDRGVVVQQRDDSTSDSSDKSMEESSSAEMELEESREQLARVPVQTEESTSEEESSSSEESSDSSDDNSDSDDSADQDDGAQAAIQDAEMPDVSDTSSDASSSEDEEEEEEFEPEPASSPKEDAAPAASSSNAAVSSPTPNHIPGLQHVASPNPAPQADAPLPPALRAIKNNETSSTSSNNPTSSKPGPKYFTPYESPLKSFHAYRFHPRFTQEVHDGYKSLTYSNNIKDKEEFCRYETAGGVCNDERCDGQHFKDVYLPDGAILEVLGNPKGLGEVEKMRFITGLKQVLSDMRARNERSFDKIAENIVNFRHEFFGDDRVLFTENGSPV